VSCFVLFPSLRMWILCRCHVDYTYSTVDVDDFVVMRTQVVLCPFSSQSTFSLDARSRWYSLPLYYTR
jgi:hypothetical protein